MNSSHDETLRAEIAAAAARLIAEDGADYGSAKRRAAKQLLGDGRVPGDILPDNAEVEDALREYNALFFGDTQPGRLLALRTLAGQLMQELADYSPHLTGAVLNGTAGNHSDIHLQLFCDSPKDVEVFLMNRNIDFEVSEQPHFRLRGETVETVSFMYNGEGVHLALYLFDDLRHGGSQRTGQRQRADLAALEALMAQDNPHAVPGQGDTGVRSNDGIDAGQAGAAVAPAPEAGKQETAAGKGHTHG
ncbi:MAG: hypothetical protein ACRYGK_04935 [Janthinobacterium lividum]